MISGNATAGSTYRIFIDDRVRQSSASGARAVISSFIFRMGNYSALHEFVANDGPGVSPVKMKKPVHPARWGRRRQRRRRRRTDAGIRLDVFGSSNRHG